MTNCNICKKPCGLNFTKISNGTRLDKTGKVRRFATKVCDNCSIWCKGCGQYRLPINSIAVTLHLMPSFESFSTNLYVFIPFEFVIGIFT